MQMITIDFLALWKCLSSREGRLVVVVVVVIFLSGRKQVAFTR